MTNVAFFYGKEIEGPYSGIETIFIRTSLPDGYEKYPHIFFCSTYFTDSSLIPCWTEIEDMLNNGQLVTLELTPNLINSVPKNIFNKCKIMLMIDIPEFEFLKKNDVLKVVTLPYTTYNVVKTTMQTTTPDDYGNDTKYPIF